MKLYNMDIAREVKGRLPFYKDDFFRDGLSYRHKIFAPSLYIFFASVLPALAFGEQLARETKGQLTVVHVLASTAISGVTQSLLGGQPLLIIGVAEPIVIIYAFLYDFASKQDGLGPQLFLPWAAWVCVWTSAMVAIVAVSGACRGIDRFTRMAGELFGMLIAVLFLQQAIKGLISEFDQSELNEGQDLPSSWLLVNGLWAVVLSFGLVASSLVVVQARSWKTGTASIRGLLADYGVPALVVAFSGLSFALLSNGNASGVPEGVPRRISTPHTWEVQGWAGVVPGMSQVPGRFIAAALLPAVAITVLFWFDHGVSSKMAQPPELNLKKPPAYAWDMLLLSGLTLLMGLLGLPPVNGVLPQAPMHTRALATLWTNTHGKKNKMQIQANGLFQERRRIEDFPNDNIIATSSEQVSNGRQHEHNAGMPSHLNDGTGSEAFVEAVQAGHVQMIEARTGNASVDEQECGVAHPHVHHPGRHDTPGHFYQTYEASRHGDDDGHVDEGVDVDSGGKAVTLSLHETVAEGPGHFFQTYEHHPKHNTGSTGLIRSQQIQRTQVNSAQHVEGGVVLSTSGRLDSNPSSGGPDGNACIVVTDTLVNRAQGTVPGTWLEKDNRPAADFADHDGGTCPRATAASDHDGGVDEVADLVGVAEQRVSNLIQSLLVGASLGATHAVKQVPTSVVWGYFAFMALDSLPGSQFWERLLLFITDPQRRYKHSFMQGVPFRTVLLFTVCQAGYLAGVWALTTQAGIAGVSFPLAIVALIPIRSYVMPLVFSKQHLHVLDPDEII